MTKYTNLSFENSFGMTECNPSTITALHIPAAAKIKIKVSAPKPLHNNKVII